MLKPRKILSGSCYNAAQKAQYIDALVSEGCTQGTAYNRLFRDGFDEWELDGILETCRTYIKMSGMPDDILVDSSFYSRLPSCINFKIYMHSKGMSFNTTASRFKAWDFKPWELRGVNEILSTCQNRKE